MRNYSSTSLIKTVPKKYMIKEDINNEYINPNMKLK